MYRVDSLAREAPVMFDNEESAIGFAMREPKNCYVYLVNEDDDSDEFLKPVAFIHYGKLTMW